MAKHSTYSFSDIECILAHPAMGQYAIQGEGTGDINISKPTDRTVHDLAADGHVMVSKILGDNGTATINSQQTSPLNNWLQKLFNYLKTAPTDQWAQISMTVRAPKMGEQVICSGGSFQREADKPYQAQGQRRSWPLMFADIQNETL